MQIFEYNKISFSAKLTILFHLSKIFIQNCMYFIASMLELNRPDFHE